jgi:hypothetical protein
MKSIRYYVFLCIQLLGFYVVSYLPVYAQQSIQRIRTDYQAGRLSRIEYIVNRGYAAFAPERLSPEYRVQNDLPDKCATEVVNLLREVFDDLSPSEKEFFQKYTQRPSLPRSYISPSGQFKIHYSDVFGSLDQVPLKDDNANGIPDFVEEAARAFDYSHQYYTTVLGYPPPPVDGVDGDEYDIYMQNLGASEYGYTTGESDVSSTLWNDMTSFIVISKDFQGSGLYTKGIDALHVTAAHEYHHAIQFGYIWRSSDTYFYEMTSTWMEEVVYPSVNDYFQYLPELFWGNNDPNAPTTNTFILSFTNTSSLHEYGMAIWNHFLAKHQSPILIRKMWEQMHLRSAIENIEKVINDETNSSFEDEIQLFYIWNYFTGTRADTALFYSDGNLYPMIKCNLTIQNPHDTSFSIVNNNLATRYIEIRRQQPTSFTATLTGNTTDAGKWIAGAIVTNNTYPAQYSIFRFLDGVTARSSINSFGTNSTLVLIPTVTKKSYQQGGFPLTINLRFSGPSSIVANKILPTIPSPANFNTVSQVKIPIVLIEPAEVTVKIFSLSGKVVRDFAKRVYSTPGLYEDILWDGTDNNHEPVPSGIYIAVMQGSHFIQKEKIAVIR